MSELEKAARAAVEAADNTQMVQQIAAILAAQQLPVSYTHLTLPTKA